MAEPNRQVFEDRHRAESFGSSAELYDAARPSYPDELIEWLGDSGRGNAADVGCGTGQVALLLAASGWQVVGVEIDERMAGVARSHGIDVEVSSFEQWRPAMRFDLIASGQAWHWIDPEVGYRHAAELLRPGGRLAIFWNSYRYDSPTQALFGTILNRHAPDLLIDSVPFGTSSPDHAALDAETIRRSSQWFDHPEFRAFAHGRRQTNDEWLAEMTTHSPMAMLDPDVRVALLADLGTSLAELNGGSLDVEYETRVTTARRR
ncbi:MAG: class I SAM-dependent methyltransferase [Acidimicrobiales bacterium]